MIKSEQRTEPLQFLFPAVSSGLKEMECTNLRPDKETSPRIIMKTLHFLVPELVVEQNP